jgi:hypothetical protein
VCSLVTRIAIAPRADTSIKKSACFMTGSSSTLRMHIARYESFSSLIHTLIVFFRFHVELYRERCKAKRIEPVARALFGVQDDSSTDR